MSFGMFVASFVVGFTTSWKLSLVLCSMLPIIIISGFYMTKALQEGSKKNRQAFEKAGGIAQEILEKIKTVTSFSNYSYEINRFDKNLEESLKAGLSNGFKTGIGLGVIFWAIFAAYSLAIWFGSILIYNKEENKNSGQTFQAGDVLTVLFTIIFGSFSLGQASPNIKSISEACNAAYDFFKLKEREPKIDLSRSKEKPDKDSFNGNILFKGVTFKYPSKLDKIILNNLNLEIPAGKKTAIVGESGSGKSTIISLVERFYDSTQGEILVDNYDIKTLDLTYFRSLIGYVPQEPVLFNSTIKENIIFGRQNVTEQEIIEVYI
jgi:ATP-binding cassette subfamily B (MDR/TAP) protein 1